MAYGLTMTEMTPEQISKALEAGIIDAAQAKAMRSKIKPSSKSVQNIEAAVIGDEENMRFVRSFSDVFIAIGIGLLVLGLSAAIALLGGGIFFLLGAVFVWLMCEYFGRKKRAHLPTLVLALAYLLFVHKGLSAVIDMGALRGLVPALVTIGAMLLFYWRFHLPFAVVLIATSLMILVYVLFGNSVPAGLLMIASGLALFCTALAYDYHDTDRKTRFADNAFWLHFMAAPLIVNGLALYVLKPEVTKLFDVIPIVHLGQSDAAFMLGIIGVLALVSLAINRRALLVSSLGYAGFAIGFLIKDTGLDIGSIVALTLLLLGAAVVFLGVGWHTARKYLLIVLPRKGVFAKIFPPSVSPAPPSA